MKKLYFLLFLACSFIANAQIVNIPDANFKTKLVNASPSSNTASYDTPVYDPTTGWWTVSSYHSIDVNGDGEIQVSEAQSIKFLNVSSTSISDLTGIEAFTNLEYLDCHYNQLSTLNVSQNINLRKLDCYTNQLTSLDVSGILNLLDLHCYANQLTNLNLTNFANLERLFCYYNQLTTLNVSQNVNLKFLNCNNNPLTSLDVSQNMNLERLTCNNNQLTSLDVSQNVNLNLLWCTNNQLTSLDVKGALNLQRLDCYTNQLTSLDVSQNMNLTKLLCDNNQLASLNMKNNNVNWDTSGFSFDNNPNLRYICADEEDIDLVQLYIDDYGYTSICNVNSYCTFNPGGIFYEISGNTKYDFNVNGCDANDINIPNLEFSITNGTTSATFIQNSSGDYYIPVSAGMHTVNPVLQNPSYFNISPLSFTVDFPTQTSPFTQDFCVTANGVHSDVEVVVVPTSPARPGFDAYYRIIYKNIGNQVENGEVDFAYQEDVLDFISSSNIYDSQTIYGNTTTLSWNYSNLLPFETRIIDVVLNVNSPMETPAVNIGDVLGIFSEISTTNTDEDLSNNSSGLRQRVVGSYDPNDKTCIEGETVDISMVGEYVHYVIRFENTGTYPAENIVVKDMINSSKFDISTLVPLHGSHEFYTRIKGNQVEFIFENINLDFNDATNDGYVVFKIKTKSNLTVGQTFSNNASIFFDYNFPITTNTYTTTIDNLLNNQDFAFENEFVLYPNPATAILNISTKNQTEIQSLEIYNIVGQVVIAIPNSTKAIDVSSLETGTYFIKLNTEKGSTTTKFVKE